jgi:hypothetical protein
MPRSAGLNTMAQFEEVRTPVDRVAGRSDLRSAERERLSAFQAGLTQTVREDDRHAASAPDFPRRRADVA